MNNNELTQKIMNCFAWWELEDIENDTKETFEILERNNKKELQELKDNFIEAKAELIEETTLTEIVREFDKRINNTHHQYAITHHSEMTDITLYFLCDNKESLLNNEKLIDDFIYSENEADFALYGEQLAKNGITHYNSELLGENDLPKAEILKSYSYRF